MKRYLKHCWILSSFLSFHTFKLYIICVHLTDNSNTCDTHLFRQETRAMCVLAYRDPRDGGPPMESPELGVLKQNPYSKIFFLFLKRTQKLTLPKAVWHTAVTNKTRPLLQQVDSYHPMHEHKQKFNTDVPIIQGHFDTPGANHNSTPVHYSVTILHFKNFQVISSCPASPQPQGLPGMPTSWDK